MTSLPRENSSGKRLPHVQLGCRGTAQPPSSRGGTWWIEKDLVRGQETTQDAGHQSASTSGVQHQRLLYSLPVAATLNKKGLPDVFSGPPAEAGLGAPSLAPYRGACVCLSLSVAFRGMVGGCLAFVVQPKTLFGLLDISHAAASRSDLAFCSVTYLVYILYQGFCDT